LKEFIISKHLSKEFGAMRALLTGSDVKIVLVALDKLNFATKDKITAKSLLAGCALVKSENFDKKLSLLRYLKKVEERAETSGTKKEDICAAAVFSELQNLYAADKRKMRSEQDALVEAAAENVNIMMDAKLQKKISMRKFDEKYSLITEYKPIDEALKKALSLEMLRKQMEEEGEGQLEEDEDYSDYAVSKFGASIEETHRAKYCGAKANRKRIIEAGENILKDSLVAFDACWTCRSRCSRRGTKSRMVDNVKAKK
jgi:hypothetical protein